MWQCDRCKCKTMSHNGFVRLANWSDQKVCFSCHWLDNPLAVADRGASFACSECTSIPCEKHAPAVAQSFAKSRLLELRRHRFVPSNAPVSKQEHDYACTVERNKLDEFNSCRCAVITEESMEADMEEPTMVQRTVVSFPPIQDAGITARISANKRSATVTPSPEETRGRCAACHAPVEFGKSFCDPCFLQSPEGRAKRARIQVEDTDITMGF